MFIKDIANIDEIYKKFPNVGEDDLLATLNSEQLTIYSMLSTTKNDGRCATLKENLFKCLATNDLAGSMDQFKSLGACGSVELNYVSSKVLAKMEEKKKERIDFEVASVNYYRLFIENALQRHIPIPSRIRIYHELNGHWLYPIYAGILGTPLIFSKRGVNVFRKFFKKEQKDTN